MLCSKLPANLGLKRKRLNFASENKICSTEHWFFWTVTFCRCSQSPNKTLPTFAFTVKQPSKMATVSFSRSLNVYRRFLCCVISFGILPIVYLLLYLTFGPCCRHSSTGNKGLIYIYFLFSVILRWGQMKFPVFRCSTRSCCPEGKLELGICGMNYLLTASSFMVGFQIWPFYCTCLASAVGMFGHFLILWCNKHFRKWTNLSILQIFGGHPHVCVAPCCE